MARRPDAGAAAGAAGARVGSDGGVAACHGRRRLSLAVAAWLAGCTGGPPSPATAPEATRTGPPGAGVPVDAAGGPPADPALAAPPDPREFRAAWVATVANIDWPSRPGLPPETQRSEARAILERAREIGLNALILQVRPAGDAIYPSTLEPWSEYLTGAQGRAPEPAWDPLAYWIAEAHRRGLQLHAWFNPFRARHSAARSPLAPSHLAARQPSLVRRYGEQLWMDPGEPAAVAHTLAVVADALRRYDLDGVHIDDYFYPYPVESQGADLPFPDDASYARHVAGGGTLARDDWRRANVDAMVQALARTVRAIRPQALFGVSPFGLPRPDRRPPGVTGFSQYDKLYADVERWWESGWVDYLAPQLYWPIDRAGQPFGVLLDTWSAGNAQRRHLWPGLFTSSVRTSAADTAPGRSWPARELLDQVALTRARPGSSGHIHFSMAALMQDRDGLARLLRFGPYAQPALVPASPWLAAEPPAAPRLLPSGARVRIDVAAPAAPAASTAPVARWAIWRRIDGRWRFAVQTADERIIEPEGAESLVVSAVGRTGLTSERRGLRLKS